MKNIFVSFLVQIKSLKSPFENNSSLAEQESIEKIASAHSLIVCSGYSFLGAKLPQSIDPYLESL